MNYIIINETHLYKSNQPIKILKRNKNYGMLV